MFTWICPKCGGEVPPAYSECPRCAEAQGRVAAAAPAAPPPPVQPQAPAPVYQAPPQPVYAPPAVPPYQPPAPEPQAYQAPPAYQPPPTYQAPPPPPPLVEAPGAYAPQPQPGYVLPEPKKRMPAWLVVLLVFAVLGGAFYGAYRFFGSGSPSGQQRTSEAAPQVGSIGAEAGAHPFRRHLEVTGLRLYEDGRKNVILRYTVVNHSPAELGGVALRILLTTKNADEKAPAIAEIEAKVGDLPSQGTKEMESIIKTSLRAYELPDWQFLDTRFTVTAPAQ